ncbi:MAG: c-type cytochrome domain-containing protein, partial [Akkermansiaceae bacterium]
MEIHLRTALAGALSLHLCGAIYANPRFEDFISNHCLDCHDAASAKGDIVLNNFSPNFSDEAIAGTWNKALEQIAFGEMPPKKKRRPDATESAELVAWLESEIAKAGHPSGLREKLQAPEYGNYVDHQKLFDGSVQEAPSSPSRLWKRSPNIFDSMLIRGIGLGQGRHGRANGHVGKVKQPFTIEDKVGVKDYAALTRADSATLGTMMRNAEVIVDKHTSSALHALHVQKHGEIPEDQLPKDKKGKPIRPRYPKTPKEFEAIILDSSVPTDDALTDAIRKMFELVIEHPPSEKDIGKYRSLIRKCIAESDNGEGLRIGLIAIAISPDAIYRNELGSGDPDSHGRRILSQNDLAYALSYALTDEGPDKELLAAVQSG